jgi:hypothetical protein
MHVALINENTLGHGSYLMPFARAFEAQPELGITPHVIAATPLPPELQRADTTIPGLRRWGLDFHNIRWRLAVSRHARNELQRLRNRQRIDAVVINTQSVALAMQELDLPLVVCLDATFEQLAQSRWFAPNEISRRLLPLTMVGLRGRERQIFGLAKRVLPWSQPVLHSLLTDYGLPAEKASILPPSIVLPAPLPPRARDGRRRQILFLGGDFKRKGGPALLECHRRYFAQQCDLHVVTQSEVPPEPGVFIHRGLTAHSAPWRQRWEEADLFVFPSTLETFGIVLLEALAFGVPVISAEVGAAREILADGRAGWILPEVSVEALKNAITHAFANPEEGAAHARFGREQVEQHFELSRNAARLANHLKQATQS